MKKLQFLFMTIAIAFMFVSCEDSESEIVGSGNVISKEVDVSTSPFTGVAYDGIGDVTITYGETRKVTVKADDNVIDNAKFVYEGSILRISLEDGSYSDITFDVDIITPELETINNHGTGNMTASGFTNLSGLSVDVSGTGKLTLSGSATNLDVKSLGTGDLEALEFMTETCSVSQTGTGDIKVYVTKKIEGSLTGTGDLYVKGNPEINVTVSGTGKIMTVD